MKTTDRQFVNPWKALVLGVALFLGLGLSAQAARLDKEIKSELLASGRVTPELIQRLEEVEQVGARILFTLPDDAVIRNQSRLEEDVHPTVVDLVQHLQPGEMSLAHYEVVRGLSGVVDRFSLMALVQNPHVVVVDLEESLTPEPSLELNNVSAGSSFCFPSSTRACVNGGRFSLRVVQGGVFRRVGATTSDSAVFYFGGSHNWEVVAKVLNGCGINNRYWVLGAGATTQAYSLHVEDTFTGLSIAYNGAICPIADTGFFPC